MKIGIDVSQIVYEGTGVARFTKGFVEAILNYDQNNQWVFFFSSLRRRFPKEIEENIASKNHKLVKLRIPPSLLSRLWNNLHAVKIDSFVGELDWFITSDWTEPPSNIKKTTIIHDLVYLRYPETVDVKIRRTQEKRLSWVKKESKVIFADSQATKNDLMDLLRIDEKRIAVNYPGVEVAGVDGEQVKTVLKKYNLDKPFILTVGKLEPRKNIGRLIEAYNRLKYNNIDLVVAGVEGWDFSINRLIKNNKHIHLLGYVSDNNLYSLYSSCLFFIYPSIWEGFGFPVVEAMKLGAPVATSNTSSLKEIGEGAALLFDPFNINDIKRKMERMIVNENYRKELIVKGKERADKFNWKNYYDTMINTLNVIS